LWDYQKKSKSGQVLADDLPAIPCGLVAKSVFNDTYQLQDSTGKTIPIIESGIAWSSDIQYKFKNIEKPPGGSWEDV